MTHERTFSRKRIPTAERQAYEALDLAQSCVDDQWVRQRCFDAMQKIREGASEPGRDDWIIRRARKMYESDDIEIDDMPALSRGEVMDGTFVSAWVWVPTHDYDEAEEDNG